jgi:hypothetical protein
MKRNCVHCGNEFEAVRITAKFCSDACRVREHRYLRTKGVDALFNTAANAIHELGKFTEGELSFEAISFLKTIKDLASYQDISSASCWWRCAKCWKAIQKELPKDGDCSCGKTQDARWKLQKKMI